jgi:FtsH-binding integral membrane protein
MEGITGLVLVAALLSFGLIQALIGLAKKQGLGGVWITVYAIVVGVALAVIAKVVFPEAVTLLTLPQAAVFGGLNGFAATGLWEWRRGEATVLTSVAAKK